MFDRLRDATAAAHGPAQQPAEHEADDPRRVRDDSQTAAAEAKGLAPFTVFRVIPESAVDRNILDQISIEAIGYLSFGEQFLRRSRDVKDKVYTWWVVDKYVQRIVERVSCYAFTLETRTAEVVVLHVDVPTGR